MTTGTVLIKKALQRIGADSIVAPASAEAIDNGLFYLNTLLELWLSKGIDIGTVPIAAAGDEVNEPVDARSAIINNLAVELAPDFDNGKNVVSTVLLAAAKREFATIKNLYQQLTIPEKVYSSTLPQGVGNQFRSFGTGGSIFPDSGGGGGSGGILPIASGGTNSSTEEGARINLGLEIGVNVQAWGAILDDLSGLTQTANTVPYFDTETTAALLNFLDEDDMVSDDPFGLASQQSIKAFVEAQVTAADLDFTGDSGSGAVDLDTQTFDLLTGDGLTSAAASQAITFTLDASNAVQTTLDALISIQTLTVTLADAGADAFFGWDDTAGAYENLTSLQATAILDLATTALQGVVEFGTSAEYRANSALIRALEGNEVWDALAEVALTSTTNSVAWNMSLGLDFDIDTLGENTTIANPTLTTVGKKGRLRIVQDVTGTRTVAFGTNFETADGVALVGSLAGDAEDVYYYDVISSTRILIALVTDIG